MGTKTIRREVKSSQRGIVLYELSVEAVAGTLSGPASLQFSSVKGAAGDYTLTLLDAASEEDLQVYVQSKTADRLVSVTGHDKTSFQILATDLVPAGADANLDVLVVAKTKQDKY